MKDFVPYEESLELKELGFDKPCFSLYRNTRLILLSDFRNPNLEKTSVISAPTFSQAFRWFREKYKIEFCICSNADHALYGADTYEMVIFEKFGKSLHNKNDDFKTYEEAELACLKKLIQIVKQRS